MNSEFILDNCINCGKKINFTFEEFQKVKCCEFLIIFSDYSSYQSSSPDAIAKYLDFIIINTNLKLSYSVKGIKELYAEYKTILYQNNKELYYFNNLKILNVKQIFNMIENMVFI